MAEEKKAAQGNGNGAGAPKEKKASSRTPSAKKRDLQSKRRNVRNRSFCAQVNTAINAFEATLGKGDKSASQKALSSVSSLLDKGVKTGKFKLNKASRTKSRLASRLGA